MSEIFIMRRNRIRTVQVAEAPAASSSIMFTDAAEALVHVKQASSAASKIEIYCSIADDTFEPLLEADGSPACIMLARASATAVETVGTATAEITVYSATNAAYALPRAAAAARYLRLVSDAPLGPDALVMISCKS